MIGIPYRSVTNTEVRLALTKYLEVSKAASKQRPVLLPDFVPKRASVGNAEQFGDERMSLSKIKNCSFSTWRLAASHPQRSRTSLGLTGLDTIYRPWQIVRTRRTKSGTLSATGSAKT